MKNILLHIIIAMSEALKGWCEADVRGISFDREADFEGFEDIGRSQFTIDFYGDYIKSL